VICFPKTGKSQIFSPRKIVAFKKILLLRKKAALKSFLKNFLKVKIFSYIAQKSKALYAKMVGEDAPPSYIARGWAIGMFFGCSAPFGIQLLISIPCAFILRGSKIGATIGTFITNHFSIFIIYPLQTYGGAKLLGLGLSYGAIEEAMKSVLEKQSFDALFAVGTDIAMAFLAGGLAMAAVLTPLTYFAVKALVERNRARHSAQIDGAKKI